MDGFEPTIELIVLPPHIAVETLLGLTRFRRGLQSSAGHTEGFRFPR